MFGWFFIVIKVKINKLLDRVEDLSEMLEYSYQKQMELFQNVKKGIVDVVIFKKCFQLQQQKFEQQVVKFDTQVRQVFVQNREDFVCIVFECKQFAQGELQLLDGQVQEFESQQQQLVVKEQMLWMWIDQFCIKKEVIKVQYFVVEVFVKIFEVVFGVGEEMVDVGMVMQCVVDKIENMCVCVNVMDEFEVFGVFDDQLLLMVGQDDIDCQLHELMLQLVVDDDFVCMKVELGQGFVLLLVLEVGEVEFQQEKLV